MWIRFDEHDRNTPMPDFSLLTSREAVSCLRDWRGKSNLVIFFAHGISDCSICRMRLGEFSNRYEAYRGLDAEVLVILPDSPEVIAQDAYVSHLPFPVLSDHKRIVHRLYATGLFNATPESVMFFILDRYGAPYAAWVGSELEQPVAREAEEWLNYIEIQCPE